MKSVAIMVLLSLAPAAAFAGENDLTDPNPKVRWAAVTAIGGGGTASVETAARLAEALEDESEMVRKATLVALASIGKTGAMHLRPRLASAGTRADARKAIETAGSRAVPLLVELLGASAWRVRTIACEHLGALGDVAAATRPALALRLDDPAIAVRVAAVDALAGIGGSEIIEMLARALTDEHAVVRGRALSGIAVAGIESEARTAILVRAAASDDWQIRLVSLSALGKTGPESLLREALADEREEIRIEVAMRLHERGIRERVLADVLLGRIGKMYIRADIRPWRRGGHRNLGAFGGRGGHSGLTLPPTPTDADIAQALVDLAPHSVPGLVKQLVAEEDYARWNSILLLHRIGGESRKHLVPLLSGPREMDRTMAAVLLASDPEHRDAVAAVLVPLFVENRVAEEILVDPPIHGSGSWTIDADEIARATKLMGTAALPLLRAQLEALGPETEPKEGEVRISTPADVRREVLTELIEEFSKR